MNADDLADARRIDDRRSVEALQGGLDHGTGPAPALRGLGWGLLVAVVAAVVLFATVLVVEGRSGDPRPAAPAPVAAASPATTVAPAAAAASSSSTTATTPPVVPSSTPGSGPRATAASSAPPTTTTAPRRPSPDGLLPVPDGLRSVDSRTPAVLVLANASGGPVTVEWVDYRGRRVGYGEVADGDRIVLQTFVTHPWVVSDAAGEDLGAVLPRTPESTVVVGGSR